MKRVYAVSLCGCVRVLDGLLLKRRDGALHETKDEWEVVEIVSTGYAGMLPSGMNPYFWVRWRDKTRRFHRRVAKHYRERPECLERALVHLVSIQGAAGSTSAEGARRK